jgi:hypothetical protein
VDNTDKSFGHVMSSDRFSHILDDACREMTPPKKAIRPLKEQRKYMGDRTQRETASNIFCAR